MIAFRSIIVAAVVVSVVLLNHALGAEVMKNNQEIRPVNNAERDEINTWIEVGANIMAYYGVDEGESVYVNMDSVFEKWIIDKGKKPTGNEVIAGLGALLGNRLCMKHGVSWVYVSDKFGKDYAVIISGYQICPMDFVTKRVKAIGTKDQESGFFSGFDKVIDEKFVKRKIAQQVDSAEASTIAVPPSEPSGSPR